MELADSHGLGITSSVRRMGLIAYRMAMVMSALRLEAQGVMPSTLMCSDTDFAFAIDTVDVLLAHITEIYEELPSVEEEVSEELLPIELNFLNALPDEFDRKSFISIASDLYINSRTADRYVKQFTKLKKVTKIKYNRYEKNRI